MKTKRYKAYALDFGNSQPALCLQTNDKNEAYTHFYHLNKVHACRAVVLKDLETNETIILPQGSDTPFKVTF